MSNILVGATGSVAAVRIPKLYETLSEAGHTVKVVTTNAALYFLDKNNLPQGVLTQDSDEWSGGHYERGDSVRHIELRNWQTCF